MFSINLRSRQAIYEQIVTQVEDNILKGLMLPNEQLPSVRALSIELTLNPNTVSKAYSTLEQRGLIVTVVGRGTFISEDAPALVQKKYTSNLDTFKESIKNYKAAGVEKEKLIDLINAIYNSEGGK